MHSMPPMSHHCLGQVVIQRQARCDAACPCNTESFGSESCGLSQSIASCSDLCRTSILALSCSWSRSPRVFIDEIKAGQTRLALLRECITVTVAASVVECASNCRSQAGQRLLRGIPCGKLVQMAEKGQTQMIFWHQPDALTSFQAVGLLRGAF